MVARFAGLTFDRDQRQVRDAAGESLHLTAKAFDLLTCLIDAAPRVVRKEELHARLWPDTFVSEATLVSLVKELRRVLQDKNSAHPLIRTSHGVGYAFCAALEIADPAPARREPPNEPRGRWHWVVLSDRRIPLQEGENTLGRDPTATVWLDAAGVSRHHARIRVEGLEARLEDDGSKNGTLLGGARVKQPTPLRDGDVITLGPVRVLYRVSTAGMSTDTQVTRGGDEEARTARSGGARSLV
jgi:DNA-binding winged helix-turn-helix (wHTH) protein